jgi:dTMP kinase
MYPNPYRGTFIVFEGIDGSGKSTQAELLEDFLKITLHKKVYVTSEPTSSLIGGLIRSQIAGDWKTSNECLQLLFSADRLYHLEKEIIPMLEQGIDVICDRYFFSTVAYGAVTTGELDWLLNVNSKILLPDVIFLLKVSSQTDIERIRTNRHGIKLFDRTDFLSKVEENMEKLAQQFGDISVVIDGEQPIEKVAKDLQDIVRTKLFASIH